MMKLFSGVSALVFASVAGLSAAQAETRTITFLFTDDDQGYVQRMAALSKEFETANPGVKINFVSSGYDAVSKQLPVQLAVGEGPDIAKITDWQLAPYYLDMRPYMKDADAFAKLHGVSLDQLRLPNVNDPKSINGYMASQTLNLPFVNKTLFEQAGEPLPAPTAKYIADLFSWTQNGSFPKEMWGAAGGSQYKNMGDEFVNGNVVTYLAGNWMVNPFQNKIGDTFEWTAINAPCGDAGCYAMPGGTAIVGFKRTKYPEDVAHFIEFLGSEKVQREIAENYVILTGAEIADPQYKLKSENAKAAMQVFLDNKKNVPQAARDFERAKGGSAMYQQIVQRMSQLIVGELTLDQTYKVLEDDIAKINEAVAVKK